MSGIPTWQAGTTYAPGALVVPSSSPAVAQVQPANAGFEAGTLSGWTTGDPSHWTISTVGPYQGTYCVRITGAALTSMQSTTKPTIRVGDTISVSVMARITNAGTDDAHFQAVLQWLDGSGNLLPGAGGYIPGNEVQGVGGFWVASTASGVAPAGAAGFNISLSANPGTHGSVIDVDSASYTYATAAPSAGLVYKATQAAPGKSGASEPVWPAAGSSVTDNQVTWLGEYATRLIWQASPILQSGTAEPTWPTQVGAVVHDGTIDWTARSAQITDPNCPQSKIVAIGAGKVFAADNDIVRYSATVNPLDWSAANDAGYLPTGLQTYGSNPVAAMGLYRSNLVVYNAEGFQMWQLDPDPANIALLDALPVASTHNRALAPTANDLFFLSSQGVRSMGISSAGVNLEAGDVGMPIDVLVKDSLRVANANGNDIVSTYVPSLGQYMVAFPNYPPPPLTLSGNLPKLRYGDSGTFQYGESGGVLPYGPLGISAEALPAWASMSAGGLVTYNVNAAGTWNWTVSGQDANGTSASLADTTTVASEILATWMTGYSGTAQNLKCSAVANGIVLVGGLNNDVAYSIDKGVSFTIVNPQLGGWTAQNAIKFNGNWYLFSNNVTASSAPGDTFVFAAMANPPNNMQQTATIMTSAAYPAGALYVGAYSATNSSLLRMNTPGAPWSTISTGFAYGDVMAICQAGGVYIVVCASGKILKSTDLATFALAYDTLDTNLKQCAYLQSAGVIVVTNSGGDVYRSPDAGVTWTKYAAQGVTFVTATRMEFLGGRVYSVLKSTDGITWTAVYTNSVNGQQTTNFATDGAVAAIGRIDGRVDVGTL